MQPLFDQHEGTNCFGLQLAHHSEIMSRTPEKCAQKLFMMPMPMPTTRLLHNKAFWWQCKKLINLISVEVDVLAVVKCELNFLG
jgi:hypothetical protein